MKRYMEHNKIPHTGVGKSTTEDSKARFPNVPLNQILGYRVKIGNVQCMNKTLFQETHQL